jgi:Predicted integral membrane protein
MAHAEGSITINRPVKEVFDFILDGRNSTLWRPSVLDVQLMPGNPLGVGAIFKQGLKGPGGRIDGDYEIVECKPNELIRFQVITGPARPTGTYLFKSMDDSTQVKFILDFQPKGLAKLMDGMINKSMKGEVETLSNLKAYFENQK